jgi:hypothetical protein
LLRVALEAGENLVTLEDTVKDGKPYLYIHLDKSKIWNVGKKAIGQFLEVI